MVKRAVIYLCLQSAIFYSSAQYKPAIADTVNNKRVWLAAGANAALVTGSFIALNQAWYKAYDRAPFHLFNDNAEWNQVDKVGHAWTAYQVSRASSELWTWTGLDRKTSAILGGVTAMAYQGIIEVQDAYSAQWGFSFGDLAANAGGAGLYALQEAGWHQQRIQLKMSYWAPAYTGVLKKRRDQLFGAGLASQILKDYNAQTYWLSGNISSLLPRWQGPRWLNVAIGYGAEGLYGARRNVWTDAEGRQQDYSFIPRERRYYLSADVDLTRINTRSKALRTVFFVLNVVKIPAPALELNNHGRVRFRALAF